MLERLLVALLAGGHVLLEGVPGLAKTLTIKTVADVLGGSFKRLQFTPDLVPADLVGTRIYRADTGGFDTELGPGVLQLPAGRRDQPRARQGAVGAARGDAGAPGDDRARHPPGARRRSSCSPPRTRSSPRAPTRCPRRRSTASCSSSSSTTRPRATRSPSSSARSPARGEVREVLSPAALARHQRAAQSVYVDRRVMEYAVALTTATREPTDESDWVEFGASPRGSINLVHAGRALALLRGRDYVLPTRRARPGARRAAPPHRAHLRGARRRRRRRPRARRRARARCRSRASSWPTRGRAPRDELPRAPAARRAAARPARRSSPTGAAQRRRRRYAIRYPAVDVLAGVAGRAWGRHVPAAARAARARRARASRSRAPSARWRSSSGRGP